MSILDDIVGVKLGEVAELRRLYSRGSFADFPGFHTPPRKFTDSLLAGRTRSAPSIIAEIKRASPSAGMISLLADPARLAMEYARAGAAAVSVLTDERFFGGSGCDLSDVRAAVGLPVIRKDFIIDEYQVLQSRALGADAILLIAAILPPQALAELHSMAGGLGMEALVEVHEPSDLDKIDFGSARLVGINNRNLADFTIDLATTGRIAGLLPRGVVFVSESGLHGAQDIRTVHDAGATAVLVGEYFMKENQPGTALRELLDELRQD